jgi:hypothetical protein
MTNKKHVKKQNNHKKQIGDETGKKTPSISVYKTKEERQEQAKTIIAEVSGLGLSIQYAPVKELYACLRRYIEDDVPVKINIPFPEADRTIVGQLKVGKREECVICLQKGGSM